MGNKKKLKDMEIVSPTLFDEAGFDSNLEPIKEQDKLTCPLCGGMGEELLLSSQETYKHDNCTACRGKGYLTKGFVDV